MTLSSIPLLATALVLCTASPQHAARTGVSGRSDLQSQETNFTVEGKVTEVTKDKLTLSTEENIIFHVLFRDKTDIKRDDGTQGSAKDLRVGLRLKVEGNLTESGEIDAQKIEIESKSGSTQKQAARNLGPTITRRGREE